MIESRHASLPLRITVALFIVLCGSILFLPPVFAEPVETLQLAPINPKFLDFIQTPSDFGVRLAGTDGGPVPGYRPSPLDLSHLTGQRLFRLAATDSGFEQLGVPPASYDLRTLGKVTPVRNQLTCGDCWAFATFGSLESNLLTPETWNFSENNLKNNHGFDWTHCAGGNGEMSTAYLARWSGAINETDDPYNIGSNVSPGGLTAQRHVQEVIYLPARANSTDNDSIKQAILDYGAVMTSYYSSSTYSGSRTCSGVPCTTYYYNGAEVSDHAVTIVGWDDNVLASSFTPVPAGPGAFIIKNSWGTTFGVGGYFYISYYDTRLGYDTNYVFNFAETPANYSRVYQYDPLGWIGSFGGGTTGWFANIFTAAADEQISAVSFYAASPASTYDIYVYTNVAPPAPRSGTLRNTTTGTIALPGYHTISLGSPVSITSGQNFSVVVRLTTPDYNFPVPIEYPAAGYSSAATAAASQSFYSGNGTAWTDMTSYVANANVSLKAFAAPSTRIGIFDHGTWYLDDNQSWTWNGAPADILGIFGSGSAIPVVGDWNGDGITKIGIYAEGNWYLDMNGNGAWDGTPTDLMFFYGGMPGAYPVAGDWNGDGTSKIGLYADGYWYLDKNGNGVWDGNPTDSFFYFGGMPGAVPISGDWNNSGTTKLGLYANGYWYLDKNGNGVWDGNPTDSFFWYGGMAGSFPVTGDWNSTGATKIGIYANGYWYLDKNGDGVWNGTPTDVMSLFGGQPGVVPVTGLW